MKFLVVQRVTSTKRIEVEAETAIAAVDCVDWDSVPLDAVTMDNNVERIA